MPFIKELNKDFVIENNCIRLTDEYIKANKWRFKKATGSRFSGLIGKGEFSSPFKTWCQIVGIYKEDMDPMRANAGIVVEPKDGWSLQMILKTLSFALFTGLSNLRL